MDFAQFRKAGHWPTLLAAFLYFDFSFMVWVTLGPLMIYIGEELALSVDEKFTLVAIPILSGAVLRIGLGALADHIGGRPTAIVAQIVVIFGIAYAWLVGLHSKFELEMLGVVLGIAGASFAVALPQASRWYPAHYQGVVMGIAGAGNMGVVLDTLIVPSLAQNFGWRNAFGFLLVPLVLTLAFYLAAAKDAPQPRRPFTWESHRKALQDRDVAWFMFFYFITFGGFVGLANALPLYFSLQYQVSGVVAGMMAAVVVAFGSAFRPVGGYIADRVGGVAALTVLFAVVAAAYSAVAFLSGAAPDAAAPAGPIPAAAWVAVLLFSGGVLALGMGNGAVFQLIPQRFQGEIGIVTGFVGCAGGIGGFFLARALGFSHAATGGFSSGFAFFAMLALSGLLGLALVKQRWRSTWGAASGARI